MKKKTSSALVFLAMKIKKNIQSMYQKKCEEKHVDLLLIEEEWKRHYVLIKDLNTFMYDTLHHEKKYFAIIVYKLLVQKKY